MGYVMSRRSLLLALLLASPVAFAGRERTTSDPAQ
jgi:hypothetical protein